MKSIFAIISLAWCSFAYAQAPQFYADFSKTFQCPENLATEQDQKNALQEFLTWAQKKYPDLTVAKVVELRTKLLKDHHCDKTFANIQESLQGVQAQNLNTRYQCLKNNDSLYFSTVEKKKCQSIPLEAGWKNFLTEERFMVDINPSKIVREKDGAKIWARFYLAQQSSGGSFQYNYVQSVTKYFCQTKQQLLIQGTYRLNGAVQYERLSNESVMEEIEPGSISELILNYVCK